LVSERVEGSPLIVVHAHLARTGQIARQKHPRDDRLAASSERRPIGRRYIDDELGGLGWVSGRFGSGVTEET
jgi:hypothetical protein